MFDYMGKELGKFIAYNQFVPMLRLLCVIIGCTFICFAIVIKVIASNRSSCNLVTDACALKCFLVALTIVPLFCFEMAVFTVCDFWQFQCSASFVLFLSGSVVALRVKRYRYIIYYFILFLLFGGLIPPA